MTFQLQGNAVLAMLHTSLTMAEVCLPSDQMGVELFNTHPPTLCIKIYRDSILCDFAPKCHR